VPLLPEIATLDIALLSAGWQSSLNQYVPTTFRSQHSHSAVDNSLTHSEHPELCQYLLNYCYYVLHSLRILRRVAWIPTDLCQYLLNYCYYVLHSLRILRRVACIPTKLYYCLNPKGSGPCRLSALPELFETRALGQEPIFPKVMFLQNLFHSFKPAWDYRMVVRPIKILNSGSETLPSWNILDFHKASII
jgi:hypothetical protein